jgi:hypothetical protein
MEHVVVMKQIPLANDAWEMSTVLWTGKKEIK